MLHCHFKKEYMENLGPSPLSKPPAVVSPIWRYNLTPRGCGRSALQTIVSIVYGTYRPGLHWEIVRYRYTFGNKLYA